MSGHHPWPPPSSLSYALNSATQSPGNVGHACNCIGCCRDCGMCRTHPKHSADTCGKIAELNAERAEVLA